MAEKAVFFFSEPNAESQARRVSSPRLAEIQLQYDIRISIKNTEFFACYLAPEGGVVALDRKGVTISICAFLLRTVGCEPPKSSRSPGGGLL